MGFFIKLIRELNSAQNEKFVSLAIVLGLISGFLPSFSVFNLIILFIVFMFRIPLGLYFASWTFFALVSYVLDPLFAYIGYAVLKASFLEGVWTYLYNLPFMRWSGYNNTVIMGAFLVGVVLASVLYFLLNKSISVYRQKAFAFFESKKLLKWIVPKESKKGVVRISGILAFVVIFGGSFAILSTAIPLVLKYGFEFGVSKITQQPVEVKHVDVDLKNLDMDFRDIRIGKVKIDKIYAKLSWNYLVWKKFDIQKMLINNVKYDKSLKNTVFPKSNKPLKAAVESMDINIKIPDAKDLLKSADLKSLKKIEKLKKDYKTLKEEIENLKNAAKEEKNKIENIKVKISSLQSKAKNIKSPADIQNILAQVEAIKNDIKSVNNDIKTNKRKIMSLKKEIANDIKEVKTALKEDYADLSSKYDMIKNKRYVSFVESFLEPKIKNYIELAKEGYEKIKPYLKKSKKEEVKRFEGQTIKFKDKIAYPDFVLNSAEANVILKDANFKLDIKNISDNQKLYGKVAKIIVYSSSKFYKSLNLQVNYYDYVKSKAVLKDLVVTDLREDDILIKKVSIDAETDVYIKADVLNSTVKLIAKNADLEYLKSKKITEMLKSVKKISLNVYVKGKLEKPEIIIKSNIDKIFANLLNKEIQNQINAQKRKLNRLLTKNQQEELKKLGIDFNDVSSLTGMFDNNAKLTQSLQKELEKYAKKSLEKKLLKGGLNKFLNF